VNQDRKSGINYISLIDSKQVSLLSTAAGISPMTPMKRYSSNAKKRDEYLFPLTFCT